MKKLYVLIIFFTLINFVYADFTGSDFLLINNSAERYATGSAGVAKYSDISYTPYNPACAAQNKFPQISLSHLIINNNLNYEYISVGFPLYYTMFSVHLIYLYYPDSFELLGGENTGSTINYSDTAIILSEAFLIKNFINVGINIKFIKREIADVKSTGYAIDVGTIKHFNLFNFDKNVYDNFAAGISIRNLGSQLKFLQESESLPLTFTVGIKYSPYKTFTFLYDFNKSLSRTPIHNIGIEYNTDFHITPGIGAEVGDETLITGGIGFNYKIGYIKLKANYSVNILGSITKNNTLSLNIEILPKLKKIVKTNKIIKEKIVEKPVYVPIAINTNKKIMKIAVLEFENTSNSKDLAYLKKTIPESIAAFLGKQNELQVLDSNRVNLKLKKLSVNLNDFNTVESEILLGKILGVDSLIRGNFVEIDNKIQINTKLIDIKTGSIITSDQIQGEVDKDIFLLLDKTSENILNEIVSINNSTNR